jgi:hypothetical protein
VSLDALTVRGENISRGLHAGTRAPSAAPGVEANMMRAEEDIR